MEERKTIKVSIGTIISIIIIFIILIVGGILFYQNNTKIAELENTIAKQKTEEEKVEIENQKTNDLVNTTTSNNEVIKEDEPTEDITNEPTKFVMPSLFTSNAKKINNAANKYSLKSSDEGNNFVIKIESGVPTIWTNLNKTNLADIGLDISKMKLSNTAQKINGFEQKVVEALTVSDEHQMAAMYFVFLMEDGTVEYSSLQNMIDKVSTQGKITELSNIVKLQKVETSNSNWEDSSAIAIDKDNNYYDVSEYIH